MGLTQRLMWVRLELTVFLYFIPCQNEKASCSVASRRKNARLPNCQLSLATSSRSSPAVEAECQTVCAAKAFAQSLLEQKGGQELMGQLFYSQKR